MSLADHPLLSDPSLSALILRAGEGGGVELDELVRRLRRLLRTAGADDVPEGALRPHLQSLLADLAIAGLLRAEAGGFALTEEGREALRDHPQGLDRADLMTWAPYAAHVRHHAARRPAPSPGPHDGQHPDAYLSGAAARRAGLAATDNPYDAETNDHLAWENGWSEADDEAGG